MRRHLDLFAPARLHRCLAFSSDTLQRQLLGSALALDTGRKFTRLFALQLGALLRQREPLLFGLEFSLEPGHRRHDGIAWLIHADLDKTRLTTRQPGKKLAAAQSPTPDHAPPVQQENSAFTRFM